MATDRTSKLTRMHHHAFVTRDHEKNRHFVEDLLGIPLVATWCEESPTYQGMPFAHTFYELADGSALAFFQMVPPYDEQFYVGSSNRYHHIALNTDEAGFAEIQSRLDGEQVPYVVQDHGYVKSLYVDSPDGLSVEIAVDPPDADEIKAIRRADAHSELARWLAGDRRTNNDVRGSGAHHVAAPTSA